MQNGRIVVDGLAPTALDDTNLRDDPWSFALDQRAFGPRKLLVAFADRDGQFRGLAYTRRTDPPDLALRACIRFLGCGAAAAVAYCDEEVVAGLFDLDRLERRFRTAVDVCEQAAIHLVDWIACDDDQFRSGRHALGWADDDWWDVPVPPLGPPSPGPPGRTSGRVTPPGAAQPRRRRKGGRHR